MVTMLVDACNAYAFEFADIHKKRRESERARDRGIEEEQQREIEREGTRQREKTEKGERERENYCQWEQGFTPIMSLGYTSCPRGKSS